MHASTFLKDYQVPPFLIERIDLTFQINSALTRVQALMRVKRNPQYPGKEPHLLLHGEKLTLKHVKVNQKTLSVLDYQLTPQDLTIYSVPDEFVLDIATEINPQENTELSGLYASRGLLVTQCESEGFRRMMFFCDRPDVLSIYTTTLIAEQASYPVLLSNGNVVEQGALDHGYHFKKWADPFPKPSYLFALVAGKLGVVESRFVTQSGRDVSLLIYVQKENLNKCKQAMESLKQAMRWDEQAFGREYDLDIYMIVAVDDFNFGAMENKGLNIFNTKYILARPDIATDMDYLHIQSVVGHEYFHNWSGNRITCRDWFQLSLKEGLTIFREQEFHAAMTDPIVARIQDVRLLRSEQFAQDSSAVAHPVQPDSYMEISNFYTRTIYEKGAEIIRMMQTLLGPEGFKQGMDQYFSSYDGQAVTIQDLVKAMEQANQVDFKQFCLWYSQAGTPEVFVFSEYRADTQEFILKMEQLLPPTTEQWVKPPLHIPIRMGLIDAQGHAVPLQLAGAELSEPPMEMILELTKAQQEFKFIHVPGEVVPSLLRQFSAPIKLRYPYTQQDLLFLLAHDSDLFNRWEALQRLWVLFFNVGISQLNANKPVLLDEEFVRIYQAILRNTQLSPLLLAEFMAIPSESTIAETMAQVDVDQLLQVRRQLLTGIAKACKTEFWQIYKQNHEVSAYQPSIEQIGKRSIKNSALDFLMSLQEADTIAACFKQFNAANNMTDKLAAFAALMHVESPEREKAIYEFYELWQHEPLVLDMWFAAQAKSQIPDMLRRVKELTMHPKFDFKNPNRVSALIGNFCLRNWLNFHAKDGSGYAFLTEMLFILDGINPMVAAHMAEPFSRWHRLDEERQRLIQHELSILMKRPLSKDLHEMVSRSLA